MKGNLIVVSGPSGVGKDTICNELINKNKNIVYSVSMTTREKRNGEVDGINYYFVDEETFNRNINDGNFIEYAKVYDKYYGTPKDKVIESLNNGKDVLLVLDIVGALNIKKEYPNGIFIFIMPPDMKTLLNRVKQRGGDKEKIIERFKEDYQMINEYSKYNYVVINDDLNSAVEKVKAIIISSKCSVERFEEINIGNSEEIIHDVFMS